MRDNRLMKWSINKDRPGREYKKKFLKKLKFEETNFKSKNLQTSMFSTTLNSKKKKKIENFF